ncbi:MAG TPA: glycosyltransferase, partial [Candidatus Limnocylindria bacterium]|nr:glycosyltransferase [Candidatus Limnocylindria bacterium]
MKILLVGNYIPDNQRSMQRFATMLHEGLIARGHEVRRIQPAPTFGRAKWLSCGLLKWLAYIDKFVVFRPSLRRAASWANVVHICDHSNAMYATALRNKPHVVTCHDLLAVRGALGENTDCPASFTGKILQRWILRSLKRAQRVVCISTATQRDLIRLAGGEMKTRSSVVMLGVAPTLARRNGENADALAEDFPALESGRPFLLNVGSNLRRKNRDGVLRIFKKVSEQFDCDLVFAGEALSDELKRVKKEIALNGRVIEVPHPSDE